MLGSFLQHHLGLRSPSSDLTPSLGGDVSFLVFHKKKKKKAQTDLEKKNQKINKSETEQLNDAINKTVRER